MWRKAFLFALLLLSPLTAHGEALVDLLSHPNAPYGFSGGQPVLTVVFPAIYAADACILLQVADGQAALIDGGTRADWPTLYATLHDLGIIELDWALNTHPHHDHLPGVVLAAENLAVSRVFIAFPPNENEQMIQAMAALQSARVPVEQTPERFQWGAVTVETFQAPGKLSVNNRSLVTRVTCGERSLVLLADIEVGGQQALLLSDLAAEADILKYPHHGHRAMDTALLDKLNPSLAIVTARPGRAREGLDCLAQRGIPAYCTADGALRLRTDGHIWVLDRISVPD